MVNPAEAAEAEVVGGQGHLIGPLLLYREEIALIGAVGVKVKGEIVLAPAVHQHLVPLMGPQVLRLACQEPGLSGQGDHGHLKGVQIFVFKVGIVCQGPLAAAILVAPAVALPGEVDPLRVAELVAHEGQVALAAQTHGQQTDHLVQGHAPVDHQILVVIGHTPVHFLVAQAEHHRLVPHQRLVVGLHIADDLLLGSAARQLRPEHPHIPVVVPDLLQELDPHIRLAHGQAVVKAHTAVFNGQAQPRQGGGVLGDGDGVGIYLAHQFVGKLEIGDGLGVGIHGEILVVGAEGGAQTVVVVQHGGDTVKAEAVKVVLRLPVFQVGQQEVQHLVLTVVKDLGVPGGMVPLAPCVEELVVGAVKLVDALPGIFGGVGMDHVQKHRQTQLMGLVHQGLQFLRGAEAGGGGKEIGHLVAEGGIIGMLHNGHDLDGIVAQSLDPGQNPLPKFIIGTHPGLLLGHANVALIDVEGLLRLEIPVGPVKFLLRRVDDGTPAHVPGVLHHIVGIERNPVQLPALTRHDGHDLLAVPQGVLPGQEYLEDAVFQLLHGAAVPVPVVKVTGQVHGLRAGGPLPVDPAVAAPMDAVEQMAVGKVRKRLAGGQQGGLGADVVLHPQIQIGLIFFQQRVDFGHFQLHKSISLSVIVVFWVNGNL